MCEFGVQRNFPFLESVFALCLHYVCLYVFVKEAEWKDLLSSLLHCYSGFSCEILNPILLDRAIDVCARYSVPSIPLYMELLKLFPIINAEVVSSQSLQQFHF